MLRHGMRLLWAGHGEEIAREKRTLLRREALKKGEVRFGGRRELGDREPSHLGVAWHFALPKPRQRTGRNATGTGTLRRRCDRVRHDRQLPPGRQAPP